MAGVLNAVDESPPSDTVMQNVSSWLTAQGLDSPHALEGVTEADIDSRDPPTDLASRAFLKRTLRSVEAAQQAKRFRAWQPASSEVPSEVGQSGAVAAGASGMSASLLPMLRLLRWLGLS